MNIYSILHYIAILTIIIPPFIIKDKKYLLIYIIYAIFVILHWKFNNNECYLTNLEKKYYPNEFNNKSNKEEGFIVKKLKDYGFEKAAEFEYLTEVIILLLVLLSVIKLY